MHHYRFTTQPLENLPGNHIFITLLDQQRCNPVGHAKLTYLNLRNANEIERILMMDSTPEISTMAYTLFDNDGMGHQLNNHDFDALHIRRDLDPLFNILHLSEIEVDPLMMGMGLGKVLMKTIASLYNEPTLLTAEAIPLQFSEHNDRDRYQNLDGDEEQSSIQLHQFYRECGLLTSQSTFNDHSHWLISDTDTIQQSLVNIPCAFSMDGSMAKSRTITISNNAYSAPTM
ncbi:hypothetical protein AB6D11_06050 [Vibrio splendidus]